MSFSSNQDGHDHIQVLEKRPDKSEGKLLLDLEVEQGFQCLIIKPTRVEKRGTIITN